MFAKTFGVAFLGSLILTPLIRLLAHRLGIVDHPDKHRKLHASSTALGGGVAVLVAMIAAAMLPLWSDRGIWLALDGDGFFLGGLFLSTLSLCTVGLIDDRWGIRGRQKLLGQILAAGMLVAFGMRIDRFEVFGATFELGIMAGPLTVCWLLGAINAVNLLDGMDGLATSIGIVLSLAIAVMAHMAGHPLEAILALALAGALTGFLVYNSPPASIFLGDAGSMIIGLILGALAIRSSLKGPASAVLAAPTAILAIPIFDVTMAILRRRLTGRSIYTTDRGHLHHSLQERGLSDRKILVLVGGACGVTAAGATLSVYMDHEWMAYAAIFAVLGVFVATRLFGHHECILLVKRIKAFVRSLFPRLRSQSDTNHNIQTRLRGDRQWEELWESLTTYGERFDLDSIDLNVSLPGIGEEFHATWRRNGSDTEEGLVWHCNVPLRANGLAAGRLRLMGRTETEDVFTHIGEIISGLSPVELNVSDVLARSPLNVAENAQGSPSRLPAESSGAT